MGKPSIPLIPGLTEEYLGGAEFGQLAAKYGHSVQALRMQLLRLGVKLRRATKLSETKRRHVLEQDNLGVRHVHIARNLQVKPWEVRQICANAGHPTRRARIAAARASAKERRIIINAGDRRAIGD